MIQILRTLLHRPLGADAGRAVVILAASVTGGFMILAATAIVSTTPPTGDTDRAPTTRRSPRPGARRELVGPLAGVLAGPFAPPRAADAAIALPERGSAEWSFLNSPPRPRTSP